MPQTSAYLSDENDSLGSDDTQRVDDSKPETWSLFLPSAVSSCSPVFIKVMSLNRAFIINVLSGSHIYNCRARGVFAPLSQGYGPSAITRQ
jgi:hypothetical protein